MAESSRDQVTEIEATLTGEGLKIAVIVSRYNAFICDRLLDGCLDALTRHGVGRGDIRIYRVPGSFEIPLMAKHLAGSKKFDAVVCLGAVIRGSTQHHAYIASEVTKGIAQVSLETGVPVSLGVLTPDTLEQAIERAGTKSGNKGWDAALSAIEMANLLKSS
jgi:6,7-dimethyl-8-ribityllumazine synthase